MPSKNPVRNRARDLAYAKRRGYAVRAILAKIKLKHGCAMCGYKEHACAIDFNHYKGEKRADLTRMVTYGWPAIVAEIKKCVLLCSNCHRVYTQSKEMRGTMAAFVDKKYGTP